MARSAYAGRGRQTVKSRAGGTVTGVPAAPTDRDAETGESPFRRGPNGRRGDSSMGRASPQGRDHSDHAAAFRDRFWVSLALALPVVVYSEMVQDWLGYTAPAFPGSGLLAPLLGTAIFAYGGHPFLTGAVSELRARQPGMMLLVATAISVAFATSLATSLGLFGLEFWWELAALIVIMLLGHWHEMRAIGQASGALGALAELLPDEAERLRGGEVERVPTSALRRADVVLVRPGARVPADGVVVAGAAEVDESMVTGESRPVDKARGIAWSPARSSPARRSGCASRRSAKKRRWPASSDWWPTRSPRALGPRRSPTARRRCSSTSRRRRPHHLCRVVLGTG